MKLRTDIMSDALERFKSLPGRLLLDTCILNVLQDEGGYIWEGELPNSVDESDVGPELRALRWIFQVNERAMFQFVVSPLTIGELAAIRDFAHRESRVRWALDVLDTWQITVWETQDETVRQRRTLSPELSELEEHLREIPDLRRNPYDRLLLLETRMANCDAFLTTDVRTIMRHKDRLKELGIHVLLPSEFWDLLKPWAALWR
jgi:hypothetical protein